MSQKHLVLFDLMHLAAVHFQKLDVLNCFSPHVTEYKKEEVLENSRRRRRRRRGCGEEEVMVEIRVSKAMPVCL
jgi:hypothetical protein